MDKSTESKGKYDTGEILIVQAEISITRGKNMLLTVSIQEIVEAVNDSLKSRVWENYKHGSVGGVHGTNIQRSYQ